MEDTIKKSSNTTIKDKIIWVIALAFGIFHIYRGIIGPMEAIYQRSIHYMFAGILVFLIIPTTIKKFKKTGLIIDIILALCAALPVIYLIINRENLIYRFYYFQPLAWYEYALCVMLVIAVLEGARRRMGKALPIIAMVFIVYFIFGKYIPGMFGHSGFTPVQIVDTLYLTTEGIFGTALGASSTFVVLFVMFGAFLEGSGVGNYFTRIALTATRRSIGGPCKTSIISSSLFGTISGSSVANVVADGHITIPLMKKAGYKGSYAGAVEAVASTGGQITPPVMGSAVFIMSEITGIPYNKIIIAAALPAFLYYYSVFLMVHYESIKLKIRVLKMDSGDTVKTLLKQVYLLTPIVMLVVILMMGYSPTRAVLWSMVVLIAISFVDFKKHMTFKQILDCIAEGGKGTIGVAMACACAGIVVGIVNYTGLGLKLSALLLSMAQNQLWLALLITAITALILGMGLPTTPAYIVVATLLVPTIIKMGVPLLAAHLFAFYFANISAITPPVALAAYAAAGISGDDPVETGFTAFRLAMVSYIVPFIFAYNPSLLLMGDSLLELVFVVIFALVGAYYLAVSIVGYISRPIAWWKRIIIFAASILLIYPEMLTSVIGLAAGGIFVLPEYVKYRKVLPALKA
ncbi:MAG: TRAP transporter permease [Acetivibrionales bacterium]|jgi:TRAP transporter 4TM/12TM fusion protein